MRPDAFAAVMATGIVSIAAADHEFRGISDALAVVSVVLFAALVLAALVWLRPAFDDLGVPIQLLTFVAACAVVGTRLGWWPLGVVALLGWLVLLPMALRAMWRYRWTGLRDRARGGGELASVATSGLAIVAADLGFVGVAIGLLALAICQYCAITGLVIWRAVHEPSAPDLFQADAWILMGGAAIFPLGMYSSATFATAVETGWHPLTTVSLVFFWIALAAWVLVAFLVISARSHALGVD